MATLEDKILGEKLHNYCSSSEDDCESDSDSDKKQPLKASTEAPPAPPADRWEGTSTNTGPKGVIKDWQRYKQLEIEKKCEDDKEKIELMKKLTLTVRTTLEDEREKAAQEDPDLAELLNDDFLINYQKKRMQEMLQQTNHNLKFGKLITFEDSQQFLDGIDKEHKSVTIIVHINDDKVEPCRVMTCCLRSLSKIYGDVKFCNLAAITAGVSGKFKSGGVPALLIYKSGQLVGNFVRMTNELGNDFSPEDVQSFLIEHGMLEDKSCIPAIIKQRESDSDSE